MQQTETEQTKADQLFCKQGQGGGGARVEGVERGGEDVARARVWYRFLLLLGRFRFSWSNRCRVVLVEAVLFLCADIELLEEVISVILSQIIQTLGRYTCAWLPHDACSRFSDGSHD